MNHRPPKDTNQPPARSTKLSTRQKLQIILIFTPFAVFFIVFALLVNDIRHPVIQRDTCIVTATGEDARPYRARGRYLYRQSENVQTDISLRCDRMGTVLINDVQPFIGAIGSGQAATVASRQYRFLPLRWELHVRTGVN